MTNPLSRISVPLAALAIFALIALSALAVWWYARLLHTEPVADISHLRVLIDSANDKSTQSALSCLLQDNPMPSEHGIREMQKTINELKSINLSKTFTASNMIPDLTCRKILNHTKYGLSLL